MPGRSRGFLASSPIVERHEDTKTRGTPTDSPAPYDPAPAVSRPQPWPPARSWPAPPPPSTGLAAPGTPAKDVTFGRDDDNADNPFIQPPGVTAKQHMDNTDLLFGRANKDLLVGKLGDDTLLGGEGSDILIGGPEKGRPRTATSWSARRATTSTSGHRATAATPSPASRATDTMIFAPFVETAERRPAAHPRPRPQDPARRHRRPGRLQLHDRQGPALGAASASSSWSGSTSTAHRS